MHLKRVAAHTFFVLAFTMMSNVTQAQNNSLPEASVGVEIMQQEGFLSRNSIKISYEDALPGKFQRSDVLDMYAIVGKTIVISTDTPEQFSSFIKVTVPYNSQLLRENDGPSVFFWNPKKQRYDVVGVISFNPDAGTVTFATVYTSKHPQHSKYIILADKP